MTDDIQQARQRAADAAFNVWAGKDNVSKIPLIKIAFVDGFIAGNVPELVEDFYDNTDAQGNPFNMSQPPDPGRMAYQLFDFDTHDMAEFLNACGRIMAEREHSGNPQDWMETLVESIKTDENVERISDDAQRFILTLAELVERTDEV